MNEDMMHLVKITLANLPVGSIVPSDEQIISAMNNAVAKEADMSRQIIGSAGTLGGVFDGFAAVMSGMIRESLAV